MQHSRKVSQTKLIILLVAGSCHILELKSLRRYDKTCTLSHGCITLLVGVECGCVY